MASTDHEAARLETLLSLQLLDTPREIEFDEVVKLAAEICRTPISLISLVDDRRQWFKAAVGLGVPETAREISFCSHAIQQPDLFQVEDALNDVRFADNPLVLRDPNIRFYAGVPLLTPNGHAMGTLCVIDRVPRVLRQQQEEALEILASQLMARFELRLKQRELEAALAENERVNTELRASEEELKRANQLLQKLAVSDELTGLANRRAFQEALTREFADAQRQRSDLSLLVMDIDSFKSRNDRWGHAVGDDTLRMFGDILASTAGPTDLAVRCGGDEFMMLLPGSSVGRAYEVAHRVRARVTATAWPHQPVTISTGIGTYSAEMLNAQQLFMQADCGLYVAKRTGKNKIEAMDSVIPVIRSS